VLFAIVKEREPVLPPPAFERPPKLTGTYTAVATSPDRYR
jgi:hypothetical protein